MRKVLTWLLSWLVACACLPAAAQMPLRVVVISNDFVLPDKIAHIDALARDAGVHFVHAAIDADGDLDAAIAGSDLLLLDTPRPSDAAAVQEALADRLVATGLRWVRIGGGPPMSGGLPEPQARRIAGYYGGGGVGNFRHLAMYLTAILRSGDASSVPPPVQMPVTGYYHPEAARVFVDVEDYRQWRRARSGVATARPGAAILVSSGAVAGLQTRVLDAIVAAAQARGVDAFGVWFDSARPDGLQRALDGLDVDAIVNLTHLQDGGLRREEFARLGMPVLQALNWRQGTPAQWRAATSGVSMPLVPTFLAMPEGWGASDPLVVGAVEHGAQVPIPEQVDLLAAKLARLAALHHTVNADKRLALMFWNYPAGETNLSASHLNVPRSLEHLTAALADAGYRVTPAEERRLIDDLQALLAGLYRPDTLDALHARGLAGALPLATYERWLQTLPETQRNALFRAHGAPGDSPAARRIDGERVMLVPRLELGSLAIVPQPPRGARPGQSSHDLSAVPDHRYLATYLYLRSDLRADALIHFGTHGTQEWTPGKDRGLWAFDWPFTALGDLPVFYPYIQDNVGEAVQAKRRGRAVIVSHQTPPFAPAGLYDELRDLHALVHELMQLDEGGVRLRTADRLVDAAFAAGIGEDLGWTRTQALEEFDQFAQALHDQLHELARSAMPLGLHTFGRQAAPEHRISTVMQQLGTPYYEALGLDADELFAEDAAALRDNPAWQWLHVHLPDDGPAVDDPALRDLLAQARDHERALADPQEIESLLRGLAGGFVLPGAGGDPVRDPTLRSGRNLYPFEPDRIPTRAAYEAGGEALAQLVSAYRDEHDGRAPEKLAFSLWSSEAIRQLGVLEAQVLHALGLRPVWDEGGRVTALEIVPEAGLTQPRIDVVLQVTSVYRDQFDAFMRLLAEAIDRLANNGDHPLARNVDAQAGVLIARGIDRGRARALASLRIFSNAPGAYGSGLTDRVLAEEVAADKRDAALAETFLSNLQYAYGARDWGVALEDGNLFADQLRGTDAAVLSRSSNTHGLLSTDHPFEYLGGLATAIRHLDGREPALYIADTRGSAPRITTAGRFLASELRSRQLNPQWIQAMQAEGYAGTLQVLDTVNNLFGWQLTAPSTVRDAQWQALHDTYVRDTRALGIDDWFEAANPAAQAQMIRRMREAIDRGLWQADAETRDELDARLDALAVLDARRSRANDSVQASVAGSPSPPAGFGIAPLLPPSLAAAPAPDASPISAPATSDAAPPTVRGRVLRAVPTDPPAAAGTAWQPVALLALLLACLGLGGWRYHRTQSTLSPPTPDLP